jgi:hypothetical protein
MQSKSMKAFWVNHFPLLDQPKLTQKSLGASSLILVFLLAACQPFTSSAQIIPPATDPAPTKIWSSNFNQTDWQQNWQIRSQGQWGMENATVIQDTTTPFPKVLRINYPAGSASPTVTRQGAPAGGTQFYATLQRSPQERLHLSYFLRFSKNFDFVKGGKLPGLYGGKGNSGGDIPNGFDGFSSRLMWRRNGQGEVYAYLPTSQTNGTSIGRGTWTFQPNTWHQIEQELQLNTPNQSNGWVRVWLDGKLVLESTGIRFRRTAKLKIDGIFFSTFFGGDDRSWSTPQDVSIDFADFAIIAPPAERIAK